MNHLPHGLLYSYTVAVFVWWRHQTKIFWVIGLMADLPLFLYSLFCTGDSACQMRYKWHLHGAYFAENLQYFATEDNVFANHVVPLPDCTVHHRGSRIDKTGQMLLWLTKKCSHFGHVLDIATKVVPLCSVFRTLPSEPNFILLALVLIKFAYFSMLFVLEMACNADISRIFNILK